MPIDRPREILERHINVGSAKPVSYLPIETIETFLGMSVDTYSAMIKGKGNRCAVFRAEQCCIRSGAVYAYNPEALDKILLEHSHILSEHDWPAVVDAFIAKIAAEWVDSGSPLMSVIRQSFGEK